MAQPLQPQKRKHAETSLSNNGPPSKKKTMRQAQEQVEYPSVNELKKRIRNAKRLLGRDDLPADARIIQERALKGFERELQEETRRRERKEMISRYHFVRFLERKSATKELNRLQRREKELSKDTDSDEAELKSIARKIHIARVNLNYTIYYPLTEKYIALYAEQQQQKKQKKQKNRQSASPSASKDEGEEENHPGETIDTDGAKIGESDKPKPEMWYVIEKHMGEEDGEKALKLLREGELDKLGSGSGEEDKGPASIHADSKSKSKRGDKKEGKNKKEAVEDVGMRDLDGSDDEGSDGGFFE